MKTKTLIAAMAIYLSGCASTQPTSCDAVYEHVSHPFAGPPFSPQYEEDWLDNLGGVCRWESGGRVYTELGLGYVLSDGGFKGPNLTGSVHVGVHLWKSK